MFLLIVCLIACIQRLDCQENFASKISRLNFFDTDLLRYAAEDKNGNVIVSPASIKSVLAMILEGASGPTEFEIRSALRLSPYKDELRDQLNVYFTSLYANSSGVRIIHNANAIFVSKKLKLKKEYEQIVRNAYYSDVGYVDYADAVHTSEFINNWINQQTKGLIPNLVEASAINPTAESLFTNALYFKGAWKSAFNPKYTHAGCFHKHGTCTKVSMMELHDDLNYAYIDNLRAHAVELPYEGGRYSMLLLVPQERTGLSTLIRDLPYMSIGQISLLMEISNVRLYLPKFTIDYSESMVAPLRHMRVTTLFSKNASLTGMFETALGQVDDILHRVFISVDEKGTVAAAASSAMIIPLIEDGVQLRVDRPFLFFVRDNQLGLILFEGKIEEPSLFIEENILVDPIKKPVAAQPLADKQRASVVFH